jgi:hypothetical protein
MRYVKGYFFYYAITNSDDDCIEVDWTSFCMFFQPFLFPLDTWR